MHTYMYVLVRFYLRAILVPPNVLLFRHIRKAISLHAYSLYHVRTFSYITMYFNVLLADFVTLYYWSFILKSKACLLFALVVIIIFCDQIFRTDHSTMGLLHYWIALLNAWL